MSERHNFSLMLNTPYGLYLTRSLSQAKKIKQMEIFDVFRLNGIENYPAAGTFPRISTPRGGGGGHKFFKGGECPPLEGGGGCEIPSFYMIV